MKLSTLSAVIGLAFLSISLLFIQSSASYSADANGQGSTKAPAAAGRVSQGQVTIPAAALPPFDPAATRITESDGALIVLLESGDSRQDLHILPERAGRTLDAVQVFHADHGQLLSLRLEHGCDIVLSARHEAGQADRHSGQSAHGTRKPACGRYAA